MIIFMDNSGCNLGVDRNCVDPGNNETCPSIVYCGTSYNRICTDGSEFTSSCQDVNANFSANMLKQYKMKQITLVKIFAVAFFWLPFLILGTEVLVNELARPTVHPTNR